MTYPPATIEPGQNPGLLVVRVYDTATLDMIAEDKPTVDTAFTIAATTAMRVVAEWPGRDVYLAFYDGDTGVRSALVQGLAPR